MLTKVAREESDNDWRAWLKTQTETSFAWLRRNSIADFFVRVGLYGAAAFILVRLILYIFTHADPMAVQLLDAKLRPGLQQWWLTLGAVTWPILLLLFLAALCVALSLHVHTRSSRDFERGQEGVSRLRRDSVGVPRARALAQMLEESIGNARRAFTLQLWLSRTFFIFGMVLLASFVIDALIHQSFTLVNGLLGIGAIGSVVSAALLKPGSTVGGYLGDLTQLQLVVVTLIRQVSLLEEHVYAVLEAKRDHPDEANTIVLESVDKITQLSETAVSKIQQYAENRRKQN